MKVHIVCYEDVHGWILGKFALKLQEHLRPLGVAATISKQPDPQADINHHIIYYDYDGRKTTTETVMVTHIDTDWKRERLRQQLINAAMGICCSAESVDALAAAGLPREKLCFVNPGHDGEMKARRTVVGITSKVQPSGCKREGILLELGQRLSPDEFQFRIMGAGWEEHVKQLRLAGFTVDYWKTFDRAEYLKLMPSLDYYLYLGMDEGSMGFMDALAAGVQTIVTTQGFHLDAPGGITHGWSQPAELFRIFEGIARDKRLRQQAVGNWTWPEYAKRHFALWQYLLAKQTGQPLNASLRAPLAKMAVLARDVTFAPRPREGDTPVPFSQPTAPALVASSPAIVTEPPRAMPAELAAAFTMNGLMATEQWYHNETVPTNQPLVFPRGLVEDYKQRIQRKEPGSYVPTNQWLYEAFEHYQLAGQHVAILGSEAPWYEAMCLHYGARCTTIEYRPIHSDHPDIHALTPAQYAANPIQFDAAFSISSFEHDGLGRYGDPVAPNADLEAMRRLKSLVRPGGLLFLAVPVGKDIVVWNAHRIYGRHRLPKLLDGWKIVDAFGFEQELFNHDTKGSGEARNYIQPVFVLQNADPAPDDTIFTFRKPQYVTDPRVEAEKLVRAALQENPKGIEALKLLVSLCLDTARWAEAAQACFQILQQTPDDQHVLLALAHCLEQTGEAETAAAVREQLAAVAQASRPAVPPASAPARPRVLLIADVPNWVFHRHCQTLTARLGAEFEFTTQFHGQPFDEDAFDLIYPLEWNMVLPQQVKNPAKYVTALRSHVSWQDQDFLAFAEHLATRFQRVHVVSQRLAKLFRPLVPNLDLISHGVDLQFFQPTTRADQSGRKLRLGWAGNRACPTKGFAELIAPLGKLPGVELVFCGYSDKNLDRDQMKAFYDSLDAYVCTSQWEGNNNSLMEAAAMQRAIITTDNGTVPEYLRHGSSAIIVERQLPELIHAVIQLRDNPALRASLGEQARAAVAAKFDWNTAAERYREFFRTALAGRTQFQSATGTSQSHVALRTETFGGAQSPAPASPKSDPLAEIEAKAREALALNPNGIEALELLCDVLQRRERWAEITGLCIRLLGLKPDDLHTLARLAKAFYAAGERDAARATLERILELDPQNQLARENVMAFEASAASGMESRLQAAERPTVVGLPAKHQDGKHVSPAEAGTPSAVHGEGESATTAGTPPLADEPACEFPPAIAAELQLASTALHQSDLATAHAIYHRVFKAHPEEDRLRELAALATAEARAACPVPDFGGQVKPARLNIAILTYNALDYTKLCLASLQQHSTEAYNVFIVDNGSTDGTREWLAELPDANVFAEFSPVNLGVPGGRNRLLQLIQPHLPEDGFVIFMDNDIEVMPGWVEHFSNFFAAHPHVGIGTAVGHHFIVREDHRELGAVPVGAPTPVDVACGGFVCWVRSATAKAVGDYDERLGLFWHEDDDYTVRALAAGWEVFIVPGAPVLHHEHKSGVAKPGIKVGGSPANQRYLVNKWRALGLIDANGKPRRPAKRPALPASPDPAVVGRGVLTPPPMTRTPQDSGGALRTARPTGTAKQARVSLPIRWAAPFFNPTGYASEAINFTLPLSHQLNLGIFHDTNITSEKFIAELPRPERDRLLALRDKFFLMRGGVLVSHNPAFAFKRTPDTIYHVGRTMYETDRIPADWVGCCNAMDEVWVPSQFNVETFAASGVEREKLVIVPGAVDETLFDPAQHQPLALPNPAKFNFVSVFEWSGRKAWDVLLAGYLREFSAEDDVCLHLRTYLFGHPDANPRDTLEPLIKEFAARLGLGKKPLPRIELLTEQIPSSDLPRLYLAADCVVVPSRGEGWGRPMHEAMAMGRPVIATNWSANTEFMNAENSYLLDYELVDVQHVEPFLKHYLGHRWANPSERHLRRLMRQVHQNPAEALARGARARTEVTACFSRTAVAERVMQQFERIERKFTTPACPAVTARTLETQPQTTPTKVPPVTVAWDGSFLDYGSLSHVNRELTGAMEALADIRLTRMGQSTLSAPAGLHAIARSLKPVAPIGTQITVRHAWPPVWDAPKSGKWVQIQPWEFGALPSEWVKQAVHADEIWAYSHYVRSVYVGAGLDARKIKVVPLGIDPERFRPDAKPMALATRKSFKFLFVGGTIFRKGADVLLKAYLARFTAADDVCLVIKDFGGDSVYRGQTLAAQIKTAQSLPNAPEILHLTNDLPPESLPGLYTECDCLVHPYRGEGFGLPVLEAMACGLPVVVTGGGSTDDFATDEFAYRIPAVRRSIGNRVGDLELIAGGWLLEPDATALGDRMRWLMANRDEARTKGRAASEHVRTNWTWSRAASVAAERLHALTGNLAVAKETVPTIKPATVAYGGDSASTGAPKFQLKLPPAGLVGDLKAAHLALTKRENFVAWTGGLAALEARPFHPEAWLLLGETALAAGDVAMARECATRARQLVPRWKSAKKFQKSLPAKSRDWQVRWPVTPPKSGKPRLSVFVIAKNEEKFLGQCLDSVKGLADQLIVLDTGSTDRTVEIAKQRGAEVYAHAWDDDFSAARNAALERATGDWVMFLDADEELPPSEHDNLRADMEAPGVMAVRLRLQNVGQEDDGQCYVPRLWRNAPGLFFYGRVHEQIFPSILVKCDEWGMETRLGTATLRHHGYDPEVIKDRNKVERNLRLLRRAVEELPGEPMLLMNLGLELVRSGRLREGLVQYREAFNRLSALPKKDIVPELREALLTQFVCHLHTAKEFAEVLRVLASPLARDGGLTATMHFMAGLAHLELNQFDAGAGQMRLCLATRNERTLSPVNRDIRKAGPHHVLALCLWGAQRHDDVEKCFLDGLAEDSGARATRFDFARWLAERGRKLDALHLLHKLVAGSASEPRVWVLGAQIALSEPEFIEFACDWTGEALGHEPGNAELTALRAQALLLGGQANEALAAMELLPEQTPTLLAVKALAALGGAGTWPALGSASEAAVSAEFLRWYRRLIEFRANALLMKVNERLPELRQHLPSAARVLAAAVEEAATPAR